MNQKNLFKEYEGILTPTSEVEGPTENVGQEKKERVFGYSPFALQDAVGERNIKKMWLEYEKLRFAGIEAEELIHKIVAKVRDMVAIKAGVGKEDLGMRDYPFNKSKRDLKNWRAEDLRSFYTKLVEIYHRSRIESGNELDVAIEKTLLSI